MNEPIWSFRGEFRREYEPRIHARWHTFQIGLNWLAQVGPSSPVLVETGCVRNDGWQDGRSTYILGHAAQLLGGRLWSVDIEPRCLEIARIVAAPFADRIEFIHRDSVEFLREFPESINFLYLDSFDYNPGDPGPAQRHALAEFEAAFPRLAPRSVVLIDDNEESAGGKGGLLRGVLPRRGFVCLFDYFQSCWVRP